MEDLGCGEKGTGKSTAVKVIKNHPAYFHQAHVEIGILHMLNTKCDERDEHHIVRMLDHFVHRSHLCIVFEVLNINLYELLRQNNFRGLSMGLVRVFVKQLLEALWVLRSANVIHCDLKPENILIKSLETGEIKLIDFGSACFQNRTVYQYIQSRFYRSPEVVLGSPYGMPIDMWSLGCVAAELFLGLPLFPGASEYNLLSRMCDTLGPPPTSMLLKSSNAHKFFNVVVTVGLSTLAALCHPPYSPYGVVPASFFSPDDKMYGAPEVSTPPNSFSCADVRTCLYSISASCNLFCFK